MRFNRVFFLLMLFVLSLASCLLADEVPIWIEPGGSHRTGQAYPLPTAEAPTYGYLTVATPTLSVGTSTAVVIGTLPSNTHVVNVYAYNGDVNVGGSDVTTGTTFDYIASGSSKEYKVATTTPNIRVIGRSTPANVRIDAK